MKEKKIEILVFQKLVRNYFRYMPIRALCVVSLQIASIGRKAALFLKVRRHILYPMHGANNLPVFISFVPNMKPSSPHYLLQKTLLF